MMSERERRSWMPLYKYRREYGPLTYEVPDIRTEERTCKWCLGALKNKRQKSFCCEKCRNYWYKQYVFHRNRPPVPWRILCRDHFACRECGWASRYENEYGVLHFDSSGLDVHHIQFVSKGGTDHEDNLITLCKECHKQRHRKAVGS